MKTLKYFYAASLVFLSPVFVFAQNGQADCPPGKLCNPLAGRVSTIQGFIQILLDNVVLPIGSVVVVLFIIYSGFLFVTARGNETKLEDAKHILLYVAIGTAVLLGAAVISSAISGTIHQIAPNIPF